MIYYPRAPKRAIDGRLYADGGVLVARVEQPDGGFALTQGASPIGIVWAWVLTDTNDLLQAEDSGYLLCPIEADNQTWPAKTDLAEFYAAYCGLQALPLAWHGEVLLDSHLTIRRMFERCAVNTVPRSWVAGAATERRRAGKLWPVHVAGHPSLTDLGDPVQRRGGSPISPWNVHADNLCNSRKVDALEAWYARYPETTPDDTFPPSRTSKQPSYPVLRYGHAAYPVAATQATGGGVRRQHPVPAAGTPGWADG